MAKPVNPVKILRSGGISRQIIAIVLVVVVLITSSLSLVVGVTSFNNLSKVTLEELESISSIFSRSLLEMRENTSRAISGLANNPQLGQALVQLTDMGPYHSSDSVASVRPIEEADKIFSLQAQLALVRELRPLKSLYQLNAISLYVVSPFGQFKPAPPVLALRMDDAAIWLAQFNTKGEATDRQYFKVAGDRFFSPTEDYFNISSIYQLKAEDFRSGLNFRAADARALPQISTLVVPDHGSAKAIQSKLIAIDGVLAIRTWAPLQAVLANPDTWEPESVDAVMIVVDQLLDDSAMQLFKRQMNSDVAIAVQGKILASSLPQELAGRMLGEQHRISGERQHYFYGSKPVAMLNSDLGEVSAIVLSPVSILSGLTRNLFLQVAVISVIATLLSAALMFWVIGRVVRRPLGHLMEGVEKVSQGEWDFQVAVAAENELGQLARSFNEMAGELGRKSRELEDKIEALKEVDELKDAFLANTSHELRTPLNGIIGIAESMIDGATGELSSEQVRNLAMLVASGKRLSSLVNDILDFSKMRHHDLDLQLHPVDLRSLAEVVLTLSMPLLGQKDLLLLNRVTDDLPAVSADENRLQQILHNLVGNAIKFTDSGEISICAVKKGNMVQVSVMDTGMGIEASKLESIFKSFEQGDSSAARQYGGTGLGLAVTRQLVELHGGEIGVSSKSGEGSNFYFTLPVSEQTAATSLLEGSLASMRNETVSQHIREDESSVDFKEASALNREPSAEEKEPSNFVPRSDSSDPAPDMELSDQPCVLVVDDEPVNIQVIHNHLSLKNYLIHEALSGADAIDMMASGLKPDLILLDVMMPKLNGFEVCKRIRKYYSSNELPIILLTAKNQASDLLEGFSSGANDYLTKPFSKHELLARIDLHIRLSCVSKELMAKELTLQEYASNLESSNRELKTYQLNLEDLIAERTQNLKQAQDQLIQAEKMASLGELVAGVAHEINTPVGIGVTAASHLVDETNLVRSKYVNNQISREDFDRFLGVSLKSGEMILSNLRRATDLVKSFKQVAVDQSAEDIRRFDIREYVDETLNTIQPRLKKTRHQVRVRGGKGMVVESYPGSISQILTNLIMNSIVHAYEADEAGKMEITIERRDQELVLRYCDDGRGISEEIINRIFDPFFTTRRGQGGSGLGLHIVYNLVTQKLLGKIECHNLESGGVCFSLTLPMRFVE